jgi:protein-disulfide isomerase
MSTSKPQPQRGKQHEQDEPETKARAAASRSAVTPILMAVVVVFALVMIVLSGREIGGEGGLAGGQSESRTRSPREAVSIANSVVAGIPQHANALGKPTAPVTLELFASLECPTCRNFALGAVRYLIEEWMLTGKLRIEYHPLGEAGNSFTLFREQQAAALAAGAQNKLWNFIEIFYYEQPEAGKGELPSNYAQRIAAQVPGLNLMRWEEDRSSTSLAGSVIRDLRFDSEQHFPSVPALLIGKTGGPMNEIELRGLNAGKLDSAIQGLLGP